MEIFIQYVFQYIGTIASILSIPLAIYFYLKQNDSKYNKVRQDIVKTLSYHINNDTHDIDISYISTVYSSKLHEYNLKNPPFSEASIIEDLITDVISNPFIDSEKRAKISHELREIYRESIYQNTNYDNRSLVQKILLFSISPFFIGFLILISSLTISCSLLFQYRDTVLHNLYSDYENYNNFNSNETWTSPLYENYENFISQKIYKNYQNESNYFYYRDYQKDRNIPNENTSFINKISKFPLILTENHLLLGTIIILILLMYALICIYKYKNTRKILITSDIKQPSSET